MRVYNKNTHETDNVIKEINLAYDIQEDLDNTDILWISTFQYGFFKYNKKTSKFKNFKNDGKNPDSLASNFSFSFDQDKYDHDVIWIALQGGGLDSA